MRCTEQFARSSLSVDYVKRLLDAAIQRGISMVSFTGGEPFLMLDELLELITYAGNLGFPYIRTGTNGYLFRQPSDFNFHSRIARIADRFAATPLRNLWISVDSAVPEIHERMRGFPDIMQGIEKALPIFYERGIYPSANVGINRNITERTATLTHRVPGQHPEYFQVFYHEFHTALTQLYRSIIDLGFTMTSACYPMSVDADKHSGLESVYAATSPDVVVRFSRQEKVWLYKALLDTVPAFRQHLRIITPLSSLYGLIQQYTDGIESSYPCRGGIDYFFVDCQYGKTYPCGYRGQEDLGRLWELDRDVLNPEASCYACDWECFRDPSELFGPILQGFSHPVALFNKLHRDRDFFRLWIQDLRYARACDMFDGRTPPDMTRLRQFATDKTTIPSPKKTVQFASEDVPEYLS
jgi:MoaA/NifB/PqqE/SkfB family radical SAM enzyme